MEQEIVLSSYSVKNTGNNTPENFTTKFTRPIILDSNTICYKNVFFLRGTHG